MKLKNKIQPHLSFTMRHVLIASAALSVVVLIAIIVGINLSNSRKAFAAASCNLNQARNGTDSLPTTPMNWANGNLGVSQAHYMEDWSAPYQCVMSGLTIGTQVTLTIGYDIRNSSKNAIDFLTHYNRLAPHNYYRLHTTAETIDPLLGTGLASNTTFATYTIPAPSSTGSLVSGQPTTSFNALSASEKLMTIYKGTIDTIYYVSQGSLSASSSETQVAIKFTPTGSTVVLLWGGHIASRYVWGWTNSSPNSAGGISGSPFHMRLVSWSLGNIGSTDRSISGAAVTNLSALLPITLSSFDAKATGNSVKLSWSTSSEINNDYFSVERSKDGINFTSFATVTGAGNSTSVKNYSIHDEEPMDGVNYYRLKQTDYDGQSTYSETATVLFDKNGTHKLSIVSVSPNPFTSDFTVMYKVKKSGTADVILTNYTGTLIRKETVATEKGINTWNFIERKILPAGIYYVQVTMDDEIVSSKLVKG
jgi:hypothetical protein